MSNGCVSVLLLGESESRLFYLRQQLVSRGRRCSFARSTNEGVALFGRHCFQLILSTTPLHHADALLTELGDSAYTVFYCYPVEDGCWWLPVVRRGQICFGAPGLRPREFAGVLDEMRGQLRNPRLVSTNHAPGNK